MNRAMAPDHRPKRTSLSSDQLRPGPLWKMSSVTSVEVELTRPEMVDMIAPTIAAATSPRRPGETTAATTSGYAAFESSRLGLITR